MESVLFDLHVAVGMTVLLAIFFLLNRLYRSRRSAWRMQRAAKLAARVSRRWDMPAFLAVRL